MERMLLAAEELFATKEFADVPLAEIAARAGYTIGAFYARFTDKDALLRTLEERLYATVEEVIARRTGAAEEGELTLAQYIHALIADTATIYRLRRGTMRALTAAARHDRALRRRMDRVNAATVERFTGALVSHSTRLAHPDPRVAAEFVLVLIASTLRETILFRDGWTIPPALNDGVIVEELGRSVVRYLGLDDAP